MTRTLITLLPLLILLAGCSSDSSLRVAPPADPTEGESGSGGSRGGGGGGWPGLPALPSGPWGELDPGEMPDIYFVVAHGDPGCCWDCDGDVLYGDAADPDGGDVDGLPPNDDSDGPIDDESESDLDDDAEWQCEVDYAVVDLFGQVVAEFAPPSDANGYSWWSHTKIIPSGPGRFLAVANGWSAPEMPPYDNTTTDGSDEPPPEDGPIDPEPGVWLPWMAWEIDAVTESVTPVAWQDPSTREIVMVATGRRVNIGPAWAGVEVAVLPDEPEWLMLWGKEYDCATPMRALRAVNRLDRGVLDRIWYPEEILPPALTGLDVAFGAFALEASLDDEGRPSFLLGVSDYGCGGGFAPVTGLINWSPTEGVLWHETTNWSGWGQRVSFAGWSGGAALHVESPYEPTNWRVYRDEESVEGIVSGLSWGVRPGPMLDPAGPSFALIGYPTDTQTYGDAIHFVHGGETVWELNSLRFGLQDREVTIFDMIVLPPWE